MLNRFLQLGRWLGFAASFAFIMHDHVFRRNETVYGTKAVIGKQAVTTTGDDAKTFQAAIIEYSKDQPATKVHC